MGNHWGSGGDKEPAGACVVAVRALAASAAVAATLIAVGFPGTPSMRPGIAVAPAAPGVPASPASAGHAGLPRLTGGFLTDSRALVPFNRTLIRTVAKEGKGSLKVASAGLKRPPAGALMAPLEALISSSPFGYRVSPLTGTGGDFHLGQDFGAGCGTRVYSADSGVVRAAGWHPWGGGNRVEIDHGNGLITTYNHLEAIAVRTGDSVEVGQIIARVGTTGWSTGCHLHFETILHGRHTSPLNWTLFPIRQLDQLEDIAMVSYDGKGADAFGALRWAIPVAADNSHAVLGGEEELSEAPIPDDTLPPPSADQIESTVQTESTEQTGPAQAPPSDTTTTAAPVTTELPAVTEPAATEPATATATPSPDPATTASPEPATEATTESSTATTEPTDASTDTVPTTPAPTATEPSPAAS